MMDMVSSAVAKSIPLLRSKLSARAKRAVIRFVWTRPIKGHLTLKTSNARFPTFVRRKRNRPPPSNITNTTISCHQVKMKSDILYTANVIPSGSTSNEESVSLNVGTTNANIRMTMATVIKASINGYARAPLTFRLICLWLNVD